MKPLLYLTVKKAKNGIIEFVKSPARLIVSLIFIGIIVYSAISSSAYQGSPYVRDIDELYAIVFAIYSIIFVMISKNGFYNGASMFTMQDVNLIFTSPLKQNTVLSYGLIQQLGRSLMLGFFILFQSGTVCTTYGVGFEALVYILMGYGVTVFLSQMTAMVIYSYTSSDDKKCKTVKSIYTAVIICFISYAVYLCFSMGGITIANLVSVAGNTVARFFPVSGMITLAVKGAIDGSVAEILYGLIYCAVFWVLYRIAVKLINGDYYEDVLKSTENSFSAIAARKEGKAAENTPKNIKTGKIGLTKGKGAAALYEKHKIENRRSKRFILSNASLVAIAFNLAACFLFNDQPVAVFALSIYLMTMTVITGRWAKELSYPYIFLIPESSYKKLLYMVKSDVPSIILESILCCIPMYFICYLTVTDVIGMILARISFGLLLIGINLLLQKIFGATDKKKLMVMFYFLFILLFSIPGIITAVMVGMAMPFYLIFAFASMAAVNLVITLLLAYFCRKLLEEI